MPADVFNPAVLEALCRRFHIRPKRERSQHFLIQRSIQSAVVQAAELDDQATVLEIGPGFGSLTEGLIRTAGRVVAVELDRRLAQFLQSRFRNEPNLEIVQDDIRTVNLSALGLADRGYVLAANLPYQITSLVLRTFSSVQPRPSRIALVIQREVAERLIAPAGEKSLLAISVEFYGVAKLVQVIARTAFWPKPEVESALITIKPRTPRTELDERSFFRVVKAGFSNRRKQLHNSLSGGLHLDQEIVKKILKKAGIKPEIRPQDLELDDWITLARFCLTEGSESAIMT